MNAEETRFALLDRLHDEGVLPEECDSVIGSTRVKTRKQRADGTWAWEVTWGEPGGERTRSAGSSSTMGECLAAENWSVTEAEDGRITIVPMLCPVRSTWQGTAWACGTSRSSPMRASCG